MRLQETSAQRSHGGWHKQFSHHSTSIGGDMRFAVFLPPQLSDPLVPHDHTVPVLYWLSGLTCTDENFMQKAGAHRVAAELGMMIVAPDTSPRGEQVADDDAYDLGQGAGFYLDATQAPWQAHYQMYTYVTQELPALIEANFAVNTQRAIAGHSMGGHGALVIGLRNAERYLSVSAFSPIANPSDCPWGRKAFSAYLGQDETTWRQYDASLLMADMGTGESDAPPKRPILVDQGNADDFLNEQLKPEALQAAARKADYPLSLRRHDGYDHSYYFIATFIEDHLRFHAKHLF